MKISNHNYNDIKITLTDNNNDNKFINKPEMLNLFELIDIT